jgi:hypothetical protein
MVAIRRACVIMLAGCGHPSDSVAHRAAMSQLGTQPLEAEVPDDAGVRDISMMGPDDAGFHGACVTLHASSRDGWGCDGVGVIQDTTQGRRLEDAHVRVTSMEEDLAGAKHVTRSQRIADGWIIERTIGDEINPQYEIIVHRTINGTPWVCELTARSHTELAEVERLCLSIRGR